MTANREHGDIVLGYCADDADRTYFAGLSLTIEPDELIYGTADVEMLSDWMHVTCIDPAVETRSFETALAFVTRSTTDAADDAALVRMTRMPLGLDR